MKNSTKDLLIILIKKILYINFYVILNKYIINEIMNEKSII